MVYLGILQTLGRVSILGAVVKAVVLLMWHCGRNPQPTQWASLGLVLGCVSLSCRWASGRAVLGIHAWIPYSGGSHHSCRNRVAHVQCILVAGVGVVVSSRWS